MHCFPILLLCLACGLGEGGDAGYVTAEDERIAKMADDEMDKYCNGEGFQGHLDRDSGKYSLEQALGGENVMVKVLKEAKSQDDIQTEINDQLGGAWLVKRGIPLVLAVVVLVVAFFMCLASMCRCCAYERPTKKWHKIYVAVMIGVVAFGLLFCTIWSWRGATTAMTGWKNAQCTSVKFLDVMLRGCPKEPKYKGLLPLLKEFKDAEDKLDEGSDLMNGVEGVLGMTDELHKSVRLVEHTITLLRDTMKKNDETLKGKPLLHECALCKFVEEKAVAAKAALAGSAASKLGGARKDVEQRTKAADKKTLFKDLHASAKKVKDIKDSAVGGIKNMLAEDGGFRQLKDKEDTWATMLLAGVLIITCCGFLLVCTATTSLYRFTFHEMDPKKDQDGKENPYNKNIYKYANCTWCCGFFYMFVAFLVSGLIFAAAGPLAGVCLLLNDLDGAMLKEIGPSLNLDSSSADGKMTADVVEKCMRNRHDGKAHYLLDILFTQEGDTKVTTREKIRNSMEGAWTTRFSSLTQDADRAAPPLADDRDVSSLVSVLKNTPADAMIIGDDSAIKSDRATADMTVDPRGSSGLKTVMASSVRCKDETLPQGLGDLSGKTIPGMETFTARLAGLGSPKGADCLKEVECSASLQYNQKSACKAGNNFVKLKQQLLNLDFRCDGFRDPHRDRLCDPMNMRAREGLYTADCLDFDGNAKFKAKTCNFKEFVAYVKDMGALLEKVLSRLDTQMADNEPGVKADMDALFQDHILTTADVIANGVSCNFAGFYYQEFIDGFCYQTVWGLRSVARSYVWCAVLTIALVAPMYWVWCRSKGNFEHWTEDRTDFNARVQAQKDEEEAARKAKERGKKPEEQWILATPEDEERQVTAPTQGRPALTSSSDP